MGRAGKGREERGRTGGENDAPSVFFFISICLGRLRGERTAVAERKGCRREGRQENREGEGEG